MFLHIVLFFVVFFGGFIAIVVAVKLRQVRAASRWPSVSGEVVSARGSVKTVTTHHATYDENEDKTEKRNFARITYKYVVGGKQYTCSRLSIGEDLGNDDVQAKLERYPKGRVVEVFYDPAKPGKAVLERGLPKGCGKAGLYGVALVIAIIAVFGYGLDYAVIRIAPHLKHPDRASMVVFAVTFSMLCAWFTLMLWNQGRVARKWPRTEGWIVTVKEPTWRTLIVYGTTDELFANHEAAEALQRALLQRGPNVTVRIASDREVTQDELRGLHLLLIGRPDSNSIVEKFRTALPITFGPQSFVVDRDSFAHADSAVLAAAANPLNKRYSIVVLAGLSAASTCRTPAQFLNRGQRSAEVVVLPHGEAAKAVTIPARDLIREISPSTK